MDRATVLCLGLMACTAEGEPAETLEGPIEVRLRNVAEPGSLPTPDGGAQDQTLAPGLLVRHGPDEVLIAPGERSSWGGLEALMEDGDNAPLFAELQAAGYEVLAFASLDADYQAQPLHPGEEVAVELLDGESHFTLLAMLGQSNDAGIWVHGSAAGWEVALIDAGTEVSQEPGLGLDQAARQSAAGQGEAEDLPLSLIDPLDSGGWAWPAAGDLVEVEVMALPPEGSARR